MPNTNKMQWPYPDQDSDPWFDQFDSMVTAQDASGYAHREDRHLRMAGAGTVSFDATTGVISWSEDIEILSPIAGYKITVPANSLVLEDGESVVVDVTRSPVSNVSAVATAVANVPNTNNAYSLATRTGLAVYWVNGSKVADGESVSLFGGTPAGTQFLEVINLANRVSHDSTTALVSGAVMFNPLDHAKPGFTRSITFRATAAVGDLANTGIVRLINITDGDQIASLTFTDTDTTKDEVTLTEGTGVGEVDLVDKIYEVRISLGSTPINPTETVELYGAEIRVVTTPI